MVCGTCREALAWLSCCERLLVSGQVDRSLYFLVPSTQVCNTLKMTSSGMLRAVTVTRQT